MKTIKYTIERRIGDHIEVNCLKLLADFTYLEILFNTKLPTYGSTGMIDDAIRESGVQYEQSN